MASMASASDWLLQKTLYKCIDTIQYNTMVKGKPTLSNSCSKVVSLKN